MIATRDQLAKSTGVGTGYHLTELARRRSATRGHMVNLTRAVVVLVALNF